MNKNYINFKFNLLRLSIFNKQILIFQLISSLNNLIIIKKKYEIY